MISLRGINSQARRLNRKRNIMKRLFGFKADTSGATAVEFSLVAAPFFFMLLAIIETGYAYFAHSVLDNAILDTARIIRTGQADATNMSAGTFRQEVCNRVNFTLSCDADKLYVDVQRFNGFGNVNTPDPIDANGQMTLNPTFQPGAAGDVVLVRVFYRFRATTPLSRMALSNMADGSYLMTGSTAVRNEPF